MSKNKDNFDELMDCLKDLIECLESDNKKAETKILNGKSGYIVAKKNDNVTHVDFYLNKSDIIQVDFRTGHIYSNIEKSLKYTLCMAFSYDDIIAVNGDFDEKAPLIPRLFREDTPVSIIGRYEPEPNRIERTAWIRVNTFADAIHALSKEIDISKPFYLCPEKCDRYEEIVKEAQERSQKILDKKMRHVKFKGDIIITDPCYVVRERDESTRPKWDDYMSCKNITLYDDYNPETKTSEKFRKEHKALDAADKEWLAKNPDDWDDFDGALRKAGITNYIADATLVGDWSCETVNADTNEVIGEFCADSGEVGVFLLDDILKYNPEFNYHETKPFTTTLIKDFDGEAWLQITNDEVVVKGKGNVNFFSRMAE